MTQSIVVQVGQCGNQIGCRFWDLVLREHMLLEDRSTTDMAVWNFFRMAQNGKDELRARALISICDRVAKAGASIKQTVASSASSILGQKARPFDQMNNIVANLLIHMTSSARFSGSLNVDMNEVCTNLVPYPKLHFLVSSITPLYSLLDVNLPARRLRAGLKFVHWNQDGWKTGLCSAAPVHQPYSLLTLCNTSSFHHVLCRLRSGFLKLYNRKASINLYIHATVYTQYSDVHAIKRTKERKLAHMHHFLQVPSMEESHFQEALESLAELSALYRSMEGTDFSKLTRPRIKVLL
ncbi:hypothetical protein HPB51_015425 [Rhipicephalus microplus]|uniref:Tubulin epsilon chain n=1 Tax=Rhipicephalus microplus TaxID=6941 RepID=A0A9J6DVH8_RHIMP|nr:hypothetical protein HPB51_015425 [Rhipicephalus microplus]